MRTYRHSQRRSTDPASQVCIAAHAHSSAHSPAQSCTHSAPQTPMSPLPRTHTQTRAPTHTCMKTHPGRGQASSLLQTADGGLRGGEERSGSHCAHLRILTQDPRTGSPFTPEIMSSIPRGQGDQPLSHAPTPHSTNASSFADPGRKGRANQVVLCRVGGWGPSPRTRPPIQGTPSCQVYKKWRFHSTSKFRVLYGDTELWKQDSSAALRVRPPSQTAWLFRDAAGAEVRPALGWGLCSQESSGSSRGFEGGRGRCPSSGCPAEDSMLGPFKGGTVRGEYDTSGQVRGSGWPGALPFSPCPGNRVAHRVLPGPLGPRPPSSQGVPESGQEQGPPSLLPF